MQNTKPFISLNQPEPKIFLDRIKEIVHQCFFSLKDKKKNHIHEKKVIAEILEIYRSNKKFKSTENYFSILGSLGAYDKNEREFAKIQNIDLTTKSLEVFIFLTGKYKLLPFKDAILFDFNSPQFDVVYQQYIKEGGVLHSTQIFEGFHRKKNEMIIRQRKSEIQFGI